MLHVLKTNPPTPTPTPHFPALFPKTCKVHKMKWQKLTESGLRDLLTPQKTIPSATLPQSHMLLQNHLPISFMELCRFLEGHENCLNVSEDHFCSRYGMLENVVRQLFLVVNFSISCSWRAEPFEDAKFILTHDTVACYQWASLPVKSANQVFLSIPQLNLVPTCLKHVAAIKFRIRQKLL